MNQLFDKHPVKITVGLAFAVMMSTIGAVFAYASQEAKKDTRVTVLEQSVAGIQKAITDNALADLPTVKSQIADLKENMVKSDSALAEKIDDVKDTVKEAKNGIDKLIELHLNK